MHHERKIKLKKRPERLIFDKTFVDSFGDSYRPIDHLGLAIENSRLTHLVVGKQDDEAQGESD